VCFDSAINKTGDFVVATVMGSSKYHWEVMWQVNNNGTKYTGSYVTLMKFTYFREYPVPYINLTYHENLVSSPSPCRNCSGDSNVWLGLGLSSAELGNNVEYPGVGEMRHALSLG